MGTQSKALKAKDAQLIQIVDWSFADAARRSGDWLLCKPGCTQCCIGVFEVSQLDALRIREGLIRLTESDPERASRVRKRAQESLNRLTPEFPGNAKTGIIFHDSKSLRAFEKLGNDEPCPALDPNTGVCDLYDSRPMTCRVFGPPVRSGEENQLGVCELCFEGATSEEIARCEMDLEVAEKLEQSLKHEAEKATGLSGQTIVAFCLR